MGVLDGDARSEWGMYAYKMLKDLFKDNDNGSGITAGTGQV